MLRRAETIIFAIIGILFAILTLAISIDDLQNGGLNWRHSRRLLRPVAILILTVVVVIYRNRQGSGSFHPIEEEEL
jgi:hypothetical protein